MTYEEFMKLSDESVETFFTYDPLRRFYCWADFYIQGGPVYLHGSLNQLKLELEAEIKEVPRGRVKWWQSKTKLYKEFIRYFNKQQKAQKKLLKIKQRIEKLCN